MSAEFRRGLEAAAAVADLYASENFRMASDTVLLDPVLRGNSSSAALARSDALQDAGQRHAELAHLAQHIAAAIRARGVS